MRVIVIFGVSGQIGSSYCRHALKEANDCHIFGFDIKQSENFKAEDDSNYTFFEGDAFNETDLWKFRRRIENVISDRIDTICLLNATWAPESIVELQSKYDFNNLVDVVGPERNRGIVDAVLELKTTDLTDEISVNIGILHNIIRVFGDFILKIGDVSVVSFSSQYGVKPPNQDLFSNLNKFVMKLPGYSISKTALEMYMLYLASIFGKLSDVENHKSIRFNCISPGNIRQNHSEDFIKKYSKYTIIPRMASIDDLNGAIDFMFSDYSKYITGTTLNIDGGWTKI